MTNGLLAGRVAIVTGAAGDIGKTIARRCAEEGASVMATDFNQAVLDEVVAGIGAGGGAIVAHKHDVTSEADWTAVVDATVERFGKLDVLVNCAGLTPVSFLENMSLDDWNRVFAINTTGPFIGMRTALPALRKAAQADGGDAAVVNIASAQGLMAGTPGVSAYAATKGALRLLTRTAAVEFGRLGYNVRCNCVVPSAIGGTAMMNGQIAMQVERGVFTDIEHGMKVITQAFPLGRMAAPVDVAEAVVYLASARARSVTGVDLPVDGGRCA